MNLFAGIHYNLRGLWLGLKTPRLLFLGISRFAVLLIFAAIGAAIVLSYYDQVLSLVWLKPESHWILWLWYLTSWLLALLMVGISSVLAYLVSQVFFSIVIMEAMSRITEQMVTGNVLESPKTPILTQLFFLIRQEVPRTILPIFCILVLTVLGWLTPLAPLLSILAAGLAAIFLAWDNTDLVPARRMTPFSKRFSWLIKTFLFHLGFGLLFLIPIANVLLLSFAPVGATLYHTDNPKKSDTKNGGNP
jgi:CysZ protein